MVAKAGRSATEGNSIVETRGYQIRKFGCSLVFQRIAIFDEFCAKEVNARARNPSAMLWIRSTHVRAFARRLQAWFYGGLTDIRNRLAMRKTSLRPSARCSLLRLRCCASVTATVTRDIPCHRAVHI